MQEILIYTDGAARGNPGPGGYGIVMLYGKHKKELSKGYKFTTNNRMELLAVIVALETITKTEIPVKIFSDSKYVVNAIQLGWLPKWIKTNFAGGKKNADLWLKYFELSKKIKVTLVWVKGHASNVYNNRCDELATSAADGNQLIDDVGYNP